MKYSVQRYCAKNGSNGSPRRVYVIRDENGAVVATADEGYEGRQAVCPILGSLGVRTDYRHSAHLWSDWPDVTDLGDVDVSPGVYRRMCNYRPD